MNKKRVAETLGKLGQVRVAVVGDLMLDRYITGRASRISPEAPVPIVKVQHKRSVLGGAANVLRNLASLGVVGQAFGVIGDDSSGHELLALCEAGGIGTAGIIQQSNRPTTVKTRVIAEPQQVVRIDEEDDAPIEDGLRQELAERLGRMMRGGEIDAVIIEDYNKGVVNQAFADHILSLARESGMMTALDPHPGNPIEIKGLTILTPNRSEAFALAGVYYRSTVLPLEQDMPLLQVGEQLMARWQPELLLVTLGGEGMALFMADEPVRHMPTVAREVFDVSGAGDTVIATFTAGRLAGLSPGDAVELANHAAGVVVGKIGTVPIAPEQLLQSFEH